jgi:hypothetical protein
VGPGLYARVKEAAELDITGPPTPEAAKARALLARLKDNAGQQAPFRGTGGTGAEHQAATINQERFLGYNKGETRTTDLPDGATLSRTKADGTTESIATYRVEVGFDGKERGRWDLSRDLSPDDRKKFTEMVNRRAPPSPESQDLTSKPEDLPRPTSQEEHARFVDIIARQALLDDPTLTLEQAHALAKTKALEIIGNSTPQSTLANAGKKLIDSAKRLFGAYLGGGEEYERQTNDYEGTDAFDHPKDALALIEAVREVAKNGRAGANEQVLGEAMLTATEKGFGYAVEIFTNDPEAGKAASAIVKQVKDGLSVAMPDLADRTGQVVKAASLGDLTGALEGLVGIGARAIGLDDPRVDPNLVNLAKLFELRGLGKAADLVDPRTEEQRNDARAVEQERQRIETLEALLRTERKGDLVAQRDWQREIDASRARILSLLPAPTDESEAAYQRQLEEEQAAYEANRADYEEERRQALARLDAND